MEDNLLDEENETSTEDADSTDLQRRILEDSRKLKCYRIEGKETVQQWINKDLTLGL